ncbi:hypothetical protein GCK32_007421 [Trichostrongylus colubriformis]|uniref:Uncharacterized protein n=1 Tax=Trichostrongylus colubriformis TaxID=6319 RepID=A0AAN8IC66_TRICO
MFRFVISLAFLYITWAQYGVPMRQPVQGYGHPPTPFYQPVEVQPLRLPELMAPPQFLPPFPRWHGHGSRSRSREDDCNDCRPLRSGCSPFDNNCMMPKIKYFDGKHCQKAIVHCSDTQNMALQTDESRIISYGVAVEKVIRCGRWGRWASVDIYGDRTTFDSLSCVKNVTTVVA